MGKPLPHEPVSYQRYGKTLLGAIWDADRSEIEDVAKDWWIGAAAEWCTHLRVRLANGQLVIVRPRRPA